MAAMQLLNRSLYNSSHAIRPLSPGKYGINGVIKDKCWYATCGPPNAPCGCPCPVPGGGRRIVPPGTCRPGPIAYNPCWPIYPHGTPKKYKYIFFFIGIPVILFQTFNVVSNSEHPHKKPCVDYEYMRIRTKQYPWGKDSFFHNPHVNHSPGECEPPPVECD